MKVTNIPNDLFESLADREHERWASWQSYLHSRCIKNKDGSLTIPHKSVEHWERQIRTSYNKLSEIEKDSDRKEVLCTLKLIKDKGFCIARVEDEYCEAEFPEVD